MDKIEAVMSRFPQFAYDPDNKESSLRKLIKAIVDEFNITIANIDRIDKMIGVDTILPEDTYNRFGSLLNIKKISGETDEQYKNRLKVSITALSGGTAESIKYSVASALGILDDPMALDRIHVYDAWEYDGSAVVETDYGYAVCEIDLNNDVYSTDMEKIVFDSAKEVKAAGVVIQFVYYNFRVTYYFELDSITYSSLSTMTYGQVGEL